MGMVCLTIVGCRASQANSATSHLSNSSLPTTFEGKLVQGALNQVGVTKSYDNRYTLLKYPGGDVPISRGVCTDVIVRAYRSTGYDLQKLVHEDMKANWDAYPKKWGLKKPDTNIDHRRVPNLQTYFTRKGKKLSTSQQPQDYKPGDIVTWKLDSGLDHIGMVIDKVEGNRPLVVHNIGAGAQTEDVLFTWKITGHYRLAFK
jgi:uncharacterized protein YijF (DUF1287 family)